MKISNRTYDILRWIAQIFLPAFITFLGVVLQCFHYAHTEVIITILIAFDTFLGTLLGISTYQYNKAGEGNG